VFLPNALAVGSRKKKICADAGFEGLFPLDQSLQLDGITPPEQAQRIFDADVELMIRSDFAIANCTPFRGPSCDVGTAAEIGFMLAQGKPVFAYSNVSADYRDRVVPDGLMVEDFGLADNLMIEGAVRASGGVFVRHDAPEGMRYTSLDAFVLCVDAARRRLLPG
jgi:nucleoside 2-deoxyribosyltransferase